MKIELSKNGAGFSACNGEFPQDIKIAQMCLDIAGCIIIILNKDQTVSFINKKGCEILGFEAEEIIGRDWFDAYVPEHYRDEVKAAFNILVAGGVYEIEHYENPILTREGKERIIAWHNTVLKDEKGAIVASLDSGEDITERRQAEEDLRKSEEKFRILFETSRDAIMTLDRHGFLDCNKACLEIFGCAAKDQFISKHPGEWSPPRQADGRDSREAARECIETAYRVGMHSFEWTHKRFDGTTFPAEVLLSRSDFQDRTFLQATVRDITDRKVMEKEIQWMNQELQQTVAERTAELLMANRALEEDILERIQAEQAIRESERRYREMAELLPETVFECDEKGRLTFVNSRFYDAFGYSPEDVENSLTIFQMLTPEDRNRAGEAMKLLLGGESRRGNEYTALHKGGGTFPILLYSSPITHRGSYVGVRGFAADISDHKRVATELLKVQKLESVGILAGGIAHDFNNLLAAIIGYIDLTTINLPPETKNAQNLERARIACLQASELTKRLITFSRGGEPLCEKISLAEVVQESCGQALQGSPVRYRMELVENLWPILADEGQVKQVVHHLVLNAREAMPRGGIIIIAAGNVLIDEGTDLPLSKGAYVRWSMKDSGEGIPRDNLSRIFDPYFTTKDRGSEKGMGLGLAICYSVVKRHNGLILAESEPGVGSTFTIYLPAVVPEVSRPGSVALAPEELLEEVAVSRGKILLMDDEAYIRELMCDMIVALGYSVEVAQDGNEAIELCRKALAADRPFAAMILDLEIPGGLGGKFVIRRLLELDPGVKAIVASGYSNDPILNEYQSYGFKGAITKPFTLESLGNALREVIGSEEGGKGGWYKR
jgi:two-component system, cell cycle sensor histidine kinase and response regulator CckA